MKAIGRQPHLNVRCQENLATGRADSNLLWTSTEDIGVLVGP
jgi:hypothetical protein